MEKANVLKVAAAQMRKLANSEYDILCRLQILEGAAGVKFRSWADKGRMGLKLAVKLVGSTLDPDWTSQQDTGLFKFLLSNLEKMLVRARLSGTRVDRDMALEILHHYLMGLGAKVEGTHKPILYEVGKNLSTEILEGGDSPERAKRHAWFLLKRKVLNLIRSDKKEVSEEDAGQIAVDAPASEAILAEAFRSRSDPLGKMIRDLIRSSAPEGTQLDVILNMFIDHVEQHGKFPNKKEMANSLGIAQGTYSSYWKDAWEHVYKTVRRDPKLIKALEDRYLSEGIEDYEIAVPETFKAMWQLQKTSHVTASLIGGLKRIASLRFKSPEPPF
jgi:hypothetical protein